MMSIMINPDFRASGYFTLSCDICHKQVSESFYGIQEVIDYTNNNGWINKKHKGNWGDKRNGQWENICPDCQN
jgi:hypothetical protein